MPSVKSVTLKSKCTRYLRCFLGAANIRKNLSASSGQERSQGESDPRTPNNMIEFGRPKSYGAQCANFGGFGGQKMLGKNYANGKDCWAKNMPMGNSGYTDPPPPVDIRPEPVDQLDRNMHPPPSINFRRSLIISKFNVSILRNIRMQNAMKLKKKDIRFLLIFCILISILSCSVCPTICI